jgi:hypothetical protein
MKKSVLLFVLICCYSFVLVAQKSTLTGTIVDKESNLPLVGATVSIKGTTNGTITDTEGIYKLSNIAEGTNTVVFSFIGYSSFEKDVDFTAGQNTVLDVQLSADLIGLEQVVITGVVNPKSALESSVAVTSLRPIAIERLGAVTTSEIFKSIPGIHSESTGGEGNANISVRGIPHFYRRSKIHATL